MTFFHHPHPPARLFPWFAGPLFFGLLALVLGQDANWDLRNYHLYNPFAFLHNRIDFDMVPAQVANFYNPLLHIPFYKAAITLPPMLTGFLLGALQGLNFPILIEIGRQVMGDENEYPTWHYYLAAFLGLLGAGTLAELGTTFGDNLISLPLFCSLWILLANYQRLIKHGNITTWLIVAGAGLLTGLAPGLKQPSAVFAVGWCAAFLLLPVSFGRRIMPAFCFGIGVLTGIALTGGFWMYELWVHYGNPLFPYFNDFFRSPMGAVAHYRDTHFLPPSLRESIFLPFLMVLNPFRVGEIAFRDLRFVLLIIIALTTFFFALFGPLTPSQPRSGITRHKQFFLLSAIVVSYLVWLKLFAIYRYLLPLEMLAPLAIWMLIDRFPLQQIVRHTTVLVCLLLWLITLKPGNWGRVSWSTDYFGVHPPPLTDPARTLVIMTGVEPSAYVIPFFPPAVRFVRVESYFTGPSDTPNGLDLRMQQIISEHQGPLHVLYRSYEDTRSRAALQHFNLQIEADSCRQLRPHIEEHLKDPLYFCTVSPMDSYTQNERNPK
ncbi:MAG: hypothetical protein ABIJ50_03840 [Pseudomonadota bacterium]